MLCFVSAQMSPWVPHSCSADMFFVVCSAYELDEADTDAVDALMGMTGVLYAH